MMLEFLDIWSEIGNLELSARHDQDPSICRDVSLRLWDDVDRGVGAVVYQSTIRPRQVLADTFFNDLELLNG